jgi:signal transduction histidine kinase
VRRPWPADGRRYGFACAVTALALMVAFGIRMLTGSGPALAMAFFPALLAITFYSGAIPAVIGWLFAVCSAAFTWGGSFDHPTLAPADRWALLAFALELLRVEEQAQHDVSLAAEDKRKALSKLSHDLRTPLSTIVGWAQVLRAQNPPEQMLHGLEVIERNARTQTRIIQELLDGKPAAATEPPSPGNDRSHPPSG